VAEKLEKALREKLGLATPAPVEEQGEAAEASSSGGSKAR
jgi:hypothetical protein